ncbi:PQQ-dependent sugar dehydrogenase [Bradyrhizobium sp.]|uniref:PQQ-dependent sugar dehydrogenase n=1 Tax=Bradyrhizobium sp. TaxID=376 RepID=UPI0025C22EE8|nr:PQQ-dependent sugar dehydrogenase [Bradyrhizobium sp.]
MAQTKTVTVKTGTVQIETVSRGLEHPWALAFLPDGRILVSERPGRLRVVSKDGALSQPLQGVPNVFARGQGGLLDLALAPDFAEERLVYLTFAEPGDGGKAGTALARARLNEAATALEQFEVVFRQLPKVNGPNHFGGRIVFARDGTHVFVTLAERFKFEPAQDLSNHLGKIVRLNRDGSPPSDNPFVGRQDARGEVWSYGHRNIEAAALHPQTGELWIAEMGPRGGDELNRPQGGKNYGWPLVSWGQHYDGRDISDPPTRPDLADAVHHWTPVISPSGMTFYTGGMFPDWRGSLLIGGLSASAVVRLTLQGDKVVSEDRIRVGARVRDVRQGPDGAVYVLTDEKDGALLRLTPARRD